MVDAQLTLPAYCYNCFGEFPTSCSGFIKAAEYEILIKDGIIALFVLTSILVAISIHI